ncbi:MAG: hypothetical protein V7K47_32045 [Nostoc sp.]
MDSVANSSTPIVEIFSQDFYLENNQSQSSATTAMHTTFYKSISIISGVFSDRSNNQYW